MSNTGNNSSNHSPNSLSSVSQLSPPIICAGNGVQLKELSTISTFINSNNNNNNNNSNGEKILLVCSVCHSKVNQEVKELTEKVLPGFHDNKYSFTCKQCSSTKLPILYHLGKSWKCVIHTALFNMEKIYGVKYFHHSDVTNYVSKYPNVFLHDKSLADISKAVSMAFFNNKGYFISGGPYTGKWANPSPDISDLESTMDLFDSPSGDAGMNGNMDDRHLLSPSRSNSISRSRSRSRSLSHSGAGSRSISRSGSRSISRGRSHSRSGSRSHSRSLSGSSHSRSRSRSNSSHRHHHHNNNTSNNNHHHNHHHHHVKKENLQSSSSRNSNSDYDSDSESDESESSKKYISCSSCKSLFSQDTVPIGKVIPGPFDKNYIFNCKFCVADSGSNNPEYSIKHTPKTWTKIIHTALHNLEIEKKNRFHSNKDILQYIIQNQKDLVSEPKQESTLDVINYVLESGRRLFINSTKDPKQWCNRTKSDKVMFDRRNILIFTKDYNGNNNNNSNSNSNSNNNNNNNNNGGTNQQSKKRSHSEMNDDDHHHSNQLTKHNSGGSNHHSSTNQTTNKVKNSNNQSISANLPNNTGKNQSGNVALQSIRLTPLYCNQCKNKFPNAASDLLEYSPTTIVPSHIDKRYIYTCGKCSDKKVASLIHLPKSWKVIVHTTLYNLGILSGQKFSSNKTLYSFISDNASVLLLGGKTIDYLNKNLSGVLSSYKNLFCSSGRNMWGNVSQYNESEDKKSSTPHHSSGNLNSNNSLHMDDDDKSGDEEYQPKKKLKIAMNEESHMMGDSSPNIKLNDSSSKIKVIQPSNSSSKIKVISNSNNLTNGSSSSSNNGNNNGLTPITTTNQSPIQYSKQLTSFLPSNISSSSLNGGNNNNKILQSFTIDEDLMDQDDVEIQIHDERIQSLLGFLKLNINIDLNSLRNCIDQLEIPEIRHLEYRFLLRKSPISLKQENQYTIKDCLYSSHSNITIGIRSILPNNISPVPSLNSTANALLSPSILSSSSPLTLSSVPDVSAVANHPYVVLFSQYLSNLQKLSANNLTPVKDSLNNSNNNNSNNVSIVDELLPSLPNPN